jgi:hypothetical protein
MFDRVHVFAIISLLPIFWGVSKVLGHFSSANVASYGQDNLQPIS